MRCGGCYGCGRKPIAVDGSVAVRAMLIRSG